MLKFYGILHALFQSAQHLYEKRKGSGAGCVPLTNGAGSGSGWPGSPTLVLIEPFIFSDCVKLLNEEHWVTAGEDGHLAVWGAMKKKPLVIVSCI